MLPGAQPHVTACNPTQPHLSARAHSNRQQAPPTVLDCQRWLRHTAAGNSWCISAGTTDILAPVSSSWLRHFWPTLPFLAAGSTIWYKGFSTPEHAVRFDRVAKYVTCLTISLVLSATSFYGFALRPDAIGHWWLLLLGLVGGVDFALGLYIGEAGGAASTLLRLGLQAGPGPQAGPLHHW